MGIRISLIKAPGTPHHQEPTLESRPRLLVQNKAKLNDELEIKKKKKKINSFHDIAREVMLSK